MKVQTAIEKADEMRAGNASSTETKIGWLNELDHIIYNDVILRHVHPLVSKWWIKDDQGIHFRPFEDYTESDGEKELIAEDPYAVLYVYWLMAKIDLQAHDYDEYNMSNQLFENALDRFKKWYHRNHISGWNPPIRVRGL